LKFPVCEPLLTIGKIILERKQASLISNHKSTKYESAKILFSCFPFSCFRVEI